MAAIPVLEQFVGAGDFYIDDVAVAPTIGNNVWRILQDKDAPKLNGVKGKVRGSDFIRSEVAQLEVSCWELSGGKFPLYLPGGQVAAQTADGVIATSSPANTTLAASSAVGDTNIKLTSVTNVDVGNVLQIGPAASAEFRVVTVVGTSGSGGTGVTLDAALAVAHSNGDAVKEVLSTTIAADAANGATNLKVASVTGLSAGDYVEFGYSGGIREVRQLTAVGTLGAGGTGISFLASTTRAYRLGDPLFKLSNEGTTVITGAPYRRLLTSDYHKYELRVAGGSGREVRFTIPYGINTANMEMTATDSGTDPLAARLVIESRILDTDPTVAPYSITRVN